MDTLTELASSIVYFGSQNGVYDLRGIHDESTGDSISFVTSSDVALPQSESAVAGMRRVTIFLQRDHLGNPYLAIMNEPALEPEGASVQSETHVLSADVRGFQVWYRDPRSEAWNDKWEDGDSLPLSISFTVAFVGNDPQAQPVIVTRAVDIPAAAFAMQTHGEPLAVQSNTNQVPQREINLLPPPGAGGMGMQ